VSAVFCFTILMTICYISTCEAAVPSSYYHHKNVVETLYPSTIIVTASSNINKHIWAFGYHHMDVEPCYIHDYEYYKILW
jgi:hypothetical protein